MFFVCDTQLGPSLGPGGAWPRSLVGTSRLKDQLAVHSNGGYCGPLYGSGCTATCGWVSFRELHPPATRRALRSSASRSAVCWRPLAFLSSGARHPSPAGWDCKFVISTGELAVHITSTRRSGTGRLMGYTRVQSVAPHQEHHGNSTKR